MKKVLSAIKTNKSLALVTGMVLLIVILFIITLATTPKTTTKENSTNNSNSTNTQKKEPAVKPAKDNSQIFEQEEAPWKLKLPIKNTHYYIEYDSATQTINASLFPIISFTIPTEDQVTFLKQKVAEELKAIGIDPNTQKINWIINEPS